MSNYYNIEEHLPAEKDEIFFTPTSRTLDWAAPVFLSLCIIVALINAFCIARRAWGVPKVIKSKVGNENDDAAFNKIFIRKAKRTPQ